MSSEGENEKNQKLEGGDVKSEDEDSKKSVTDTKTEEAKSVENNDKGKAEIEESDEKDEDEKKEEKDEKKTEKVEKGEEVTEEAAESEKDEDDEEEQDDKDDNDEGGDKGKSRKKESTKNNDEKEKDDKVEIPKGSGTQLGEIPRIDASIARFKNDNLKLLHKLLFKTVDKTMQLKKNIRKFNGFDFDKESDEFKKKLATMEKYEVKQLKIFCEMLDLEKKGNKEDMCQRILEFLIEPKDSGKGAGGGRPKRTAAVRANNRGYSSHDDSYSSDEKAPRARRNAGRRANLKDETSSESDEDFNPSEASDEERPAKRKRAGRKKKDDSEDEASELDSGSSFDSDEGPKSKKKKPIANSKAKGRPSGRGRGRKPASATPAKKKTPAKRGRKRAQESSEGEDSADAHDDEGSSSEDEPLAKKTEKKGPQPPTDDEIKTYVKEILEGANLEEITMKTVCKQVYAHYPDFDLTHKKDYIKTTVKSELPEIYNKIEPEIVGKGEATKSSSGTSKSSNKRGRKPVHKSSQNQVNVDNDEYDTSDNEPFAKKIKKNLQPPTNAELRIYLKEILKGADLEVITMKNVLDQVYANYSNFDLSHKENYIKTTVKMLIR